LENKQTSFNFLIEQQKLKFEAINTINSTNIALCLCKYIIKLLFCIFWSSDNNSNFIGGISHREKNNIVFYKQVYQSYHAYNPKTFGNYSSHFVHCFLVNKNHMNTWGRIISKKIFENPGRHPRKWPKFGPPPEQLGFCYYFPT